MAAVHNPSASSVKEYAYDEDRNTRFRPQMEDSKKSFFFTHDYLCLAYCIVDSAGGDSNCGIFAIFDGHGGKQVSEYCAERFPAEMRKEIQKGHVDLCKPITDIFAKVIFLDHPYNLPAFIDKSRTQTGGL